MLSITLIYLGVGAVSGMFAGLFGVGGGLIIVPMVVYCLTRQGIPKECIMHLALGTSMASISFTAISSFLAHHRRGAVHWTAVHRIAPGIVVGTFLGSFIASRMSTNFLKGFFVLFLFCAAVQLLADKKPKPGREFPGQLGMFGAGNTIGIFSSMVGIGGGMLSVPFMLWCNLAIHNAIGTSAAIGFYIALAGAAGYVINGLRASGLPDYSIGYVYLPAMLGIICSSMLAAPAGAYLAHNLPVAKLKRVFALLLLLVGGKMLVGLF
ncbi:MAG: sulfite exporter TauE/SafE family protein [Syntrophobacteraceae bacterium]